MHNIMPMEEMAEYSENLCILDPNYIWLVKTRALKVQRGDTILQYPLHTHIGKNTFLWLLTLVRSTYVVKKKEWQWPLNLPSMDDVLNTRLASRRDIKVHILETVLR